MGHREAGGQGLSEVVVKWGGPMFRRLYQASSFGWEAESGL